MDGYLDCTRISTTHAHPGTAAVSHDIHPAHQDVFQWALLRSGVDALAHGNMWIALNILESVLHGMSAKRSAERFGSASSISKVETLLASVQSWWTSPVGGLLLSPCDLLHPLWDAYVEVAHRAQLLDSEQTASRTASKTAQAECMALLSHGPVLSSSLDEVITWHTCSLVLPAYNEEQVIEETVAACVEATRRFCPNSEIIVVNDGSRDRTGEIVDVLQSRNPQIVPVHNRPNRGYGGALLAGFAVARGEWLFFMDSDGQFDVAEIAKLLAIAVRHEGAAVLGYRARRSDSVMRKLNAWGWKRTVRVCLGLHGVRDIDCAFKLFPTRLIRACNVQAQGATVSAEFLAKFQRMGVLLHQVPVSHYPRTKGNPTGAKPQVILRAFCEVYRVRRELKRWQPYSTAAPVRMGPPVSVSG